MPQMVCPFMKVIGPGGTTGRIAVLADGPTTVSAAGRLAWHGDKAEAYGAHGDGRYVYPPACPPEPTRPALTPPMTDTVATWARRPAPLDGGPPERRRPKAWGGRPFLHRHLWRGTVRSLLPRRGNRTETETERESIETVTTATSLSFIDRPAECV
jgi:hypothetical protein